jgi:dipeptidyl aminopeptidase/acylaminoacyl peptidase
VVQGANDVRVKQVESDQLVQAMRRRGKTVDYIVFPDEGHGFTQPANVLTFHAAAEAFFARYLGGRAEPPGTGEGAERYVQ